MPVVPKKINDSLNKTRVDALFNRGYEWKLHSWLGPANFGAKGFVLQSPKVYHHVFPHSNVPSSGNGWFKHGLIIKASKVPQLGLSENRVPKNLIVAYFPDYNCYIFVHLPSVDRHDDPSTPEAASSMPVKPLS